MSTKHALISGVVLAVLGWVVWLSLSLRQAGDSLPDLTSFDLPNFQRPAAADPAPALPSASEQLPIEIPPPAGAPTTVPTDGVADTLESQAPEVSRSFLGNYFLIEPEFSVRDSCGNLTMLGVFIVDAQVHPDVLRSLSNAELQDLADSREHDGQLQRVYAQSFRDTERQGGVSRESPDEGSFATMQEYYIRAIRRHDRIAAGELAVMNYSIDKIESRAWWRVLQEMGADGLARWHELGEYAFTDEENRQGIDRADKLVLEHELLQGLGTPEECLTPEGLAEQRSHLAALARRLSLRTMPSAAPETPPQIFYRMNGLALVVENVCSFSCPTDFRRVIYYQGSSRTRVGRSV